MHLNCIIKDYIVMGGLTLLGYMAGRELGSFIGTVIGAVICFLFNVEDPPRLQVEETPRSTPYNLRSTNRSQIVKKSKNEPCELPKCIPLFFIDEQCELPNCSICLEPFKASIMLIPCRHMCFCDECYVKVKKKIIKCPICRMFIVKYMSVYTLISHMVNLYK